MPQETYLVKVAYRHGFSSYTGLFKSGVSTGE